jgi:hypothetical protein
VYRNSVIVAVYQKLVVDLENPTDEELTAVVDSFLSSLATANQENEMTTFQTKEEEIKPVQSQIQPVSATQAELDGVDEILSQESGEVVEASSIVVTTCNTNRSNLQSRHFQTRINCNYNYASARINCN